MFQLVKYTTGSTRDNLLRFYLQYESVASAQSGPQPLDFHFCTAAQNQIFKEKPDSINSQVQCVRSVAEGLAKRQLGEL